MATIRIRSAQLIVAGLASCAFAALTIHCGSDVGASGSESGATDATTGTGSASNGSQGAGAGSPGSGNVASSTAAGTTFIDAQTKDYSADAFFEEDPPPLACDGGGIPPKPGGTPECPDDKNLEGCPCTEVGKQVPCWPGKRANRNRGVCHDGVAECSLKGEGSLEWSECKGYQLPTGDSGKEACQCFSAGHWQLDNTSPCFWDVNGDKSVFRAVSTTLTSQGLACPDNVDAAPKADWSKNRLTVDCTGQFKLCYTIKAGDGKNPKPDDCTVISVCTEDHYAQANVEQEFPPLPGWLAPDSANACAKQMYEHGGYGEMTVDGQSDECEGVKSLFQRFTYCSIQCAKGPPYPPEIKAECEACKPGGGGDF